MKKLKYLILIFALALISNIIKVNAYECNITNGQEDVKPDDTSIRVDSGVYDNAPSTGGCRTISKYVFNTSDGNKLLGFCVDPGKNSGADDTPPHMIYANFSCSNISDGVQFQKAIYKIMQEGYYKAGNQNASWYAITETAIRSMIYYKRGELTGAKWMKKAFTDLAIEFANDDSQIMTGAKKMNSSLTIPSTPNYMNKIHFYNKYCSSSVTNNDENTNYIKSKAKELIKIGLNEYNSQNSGNEKNFNVDDGKKIQDQDIYEYKLTIQNYDSNSYVKVKDFICENCGGKVTYSFKVNNGSEISLSQLKQMDLSENVNGSNVYLRIIFKRSNYNCENLKIKITFETNLSQNEIFSIKGNQGNTTTQNFYIINKDIEGLSSGSTNNITEIVRNATINLCGDSCEDLEKRCKANGPNDPSCKEWEDREECHQIPCGSYISDVKCSADRQQIIIKEGLQKKSEESCDFVNENVANVLGCIVDRKDVNDNSYVAVVNNYCTISCKEDYIIDVPGQHKVTSGRKISITAKINGTKTCYTSKIDNDKFRLDFNAPNANRESILKEYKQCTEMTDIEYNYNPKVTFKYQETYGQYFGENEEIPLVNEYQDRNVKVEKCSNDVSDAYECYKWSSNVTYPRYVRATMNASASYTITKDFAQLFPSGTIVTTLNNAVVNSAPINGAPISPGTPKGTYRYQLIIRDLGEYYNSEGKLGRIWGDKKSIVTSAIDSGCFSEEFALSNQDDIIDSGAYVCSYDVNCPECKSKCKLGKCSGDYNCPSGDCPSDCVDCISVDGKRNFSYRPISSSNPNPNNRTLGRNWNFNESDIKTSIELKALKTTKNIINEGELIFDESSQLKDNVAITVNLNSKIIKKISEYNKAHQNDGGYTNNTLRCYDYSDNKNDKVYKNVYCYSTFIDEIFFYDNEVRGNFVSGERITGSSASDTDNQRNVNANANNYWTTWTEADLSDIQVTEEIKIDAHNYGANKIGPSWR